METTTDAVSFPRSPARPSDVATAGFSVVRRGFDTTQVEWFLQSLAEDLATHEARATELEKALVDARDELVSVRRIDEVTVAHFLGEESARMLTAARDTAQSLTTRAEAKAAAAIAAAEAAAAAMRHDAKTETRQQRQLADDETRLQRAEADTDTTRLRKETDTDILRQRKETEAACAAALEHAQEQAARLVAEAEAQRRRVLADLTRRRELAASQFRDLIAGRDALVRSLTTVEHTTRALTTDLAEFALVPANFVSVADAHQDSPQTEESATTAITRTRVTTA
jgi:DivIVA domain-containing protein